MGIDLGVLEAALSGISRSSKYYGLHNASYVLKVPIDRLGLVELLKVLLFLLRQNFSSGRDGLVQPLNLAEANNGTRNPLINPRQSDM